MARTTVTITEARNRLMALIRRMGGSSAITITKRDRPAAVIMPWEAYKQLLRRAAAVRLREFRDASTDSGLDADKIYRESRSQLEDRN